MSGLLRPRPWLAPLGAVFGGVAALRARLYRHGLLRRRRLEGPVVSIGNLAVGGRGKTPAVRLVAELLRRDGAPVAVLSRGYGGSFAGDVLVVSDGSGVKVDDAEVAGDEPVLLARTLPGVVVAIGPDRAHVGRAVEARFGRRVHILDDGFQHLGLSRDLDVLCLAPGDLDDRPLPSGTLREFPSAAARADVVLVVVGPDDAADEIRGRVAAALGRPSAVLVARRVGAGFADLQGHPVTPPQSAVLLSGIAAPERFEADIRRCGTEVRTHRAYGDHHRFTGADLDRVLTEARESGAEAVVTTEKDAVRLPAAVPGLPFVVYRIRLELDDDQPLRDRLLSLARRVA